MKERAKEMKEPLVDRCPLCGVTLVPQYEHSVFGVQTGNVEPRAHRHTHYGKGTADGGCEVEERYHLEWACRRCGFQWEHGEFEENDEG